MTENSAFERETECNAGEEELVKVQNCKKREGMVVACSPPPHLCSALRIPPEESSQQSKTRNTAICL